MPLTNALRKATPLLTVDRIEPVVEFWKKVGLAPVVEVPDETASDGRTGFVILAAAGVEIMYQTATSVAADLIKAASSPDAFRAGLQQHTLYVEVSRLADIERELKDERLILPRRSTFYGATEAGYLDPAGNVIVFSERNTKA